MAQPKAAQAIPFPVSDPTPEERPVLVVDLGGSVQPVDRETRSRGTRLLGAREPPPVFRGDRSTTSRQRSCSGGPASVYADGAPQIDEAIFSLGVPTLGICYGMQLMARDLGGAVARTGASEFGKTELEAAESELFHDLPQEQIVWMSHGDSVTAPPAGATVTASSPNTPIAAFEDRARRLYGVQFHPEVVHTPHGQEILKNFLYEVAGVPPTWTRPL